MRPRLPLWVTWLAGGAPRASFAARSPLRLRHPPFAAARSFASKSQRVMHISQRARHSTAMLEILAGADAKTDGDAPSRRTAALQLHGSF